LAIHGWRVRGEGEILYREWDGQTVLYLACDGSTHLLEALGAQLLSEVIASSSDISLFQFHEWLIAKVPGDDAWTPDESSALLDSILDELKQAGLVEKA
jgi:hypothetical protein